MPIPAHIAATVSETRLRQIANEYREAIVIEGGDAAEAAKLIASLYGMEPDDVVEIGNEYPRETK